MSDEWTAQVTDLLAQLQLPASGPREVRSSTQAEAASVDAKTAAAAKALETLKTVAVELKALAAAEKAPWEDYGAIHQRRDPADPAPPPWLLRTSRPAPEGTKPSPSDPGDLLDTVA